MRKSKMLLFLGLVCLSMTACGGTTSDESMEGTLLKEDTYEATTELSEDELEEDASSPEKIAFEKHINDVLIPEYGIYVDETSTTILRDNYSVHYSDWLPSEGLMATKIYDFDGDGQEEMLVVLMEENDNDASNINTSIYEFIDGQIEIADKMVCLPYDEDQDVKEQYTNWVNVFTKSYRSKCSFGLSLVDGSDSTYLFYRYGDSGVFGDGQYQSYWLMEYTGDTLEYVRSFAQTAGGSSGFEYTGYILDDGELQEKQNLYHEQDEDSMYATFETAFANFFGELVPVSRGVYEYDYTANDVDFYDSSVQGILTFDIDFESYEEFTKYIFYEELNDITNLHEDHKDLNLDEPSEEELTSSITTEEASTTEDSTTEADIETATTEKTEDSKSSICSFSSERLLTDDDIKSIMKKDYSSYHFPGGRGVVQMMINEIFARQGYVFNDSALNDYFGQFDWYKDLPKNNSSSSTVEGQMTRTERKNIKKLNAYE